MRRFWPTLTILFIGFTYFEWAYRSEIIAYFGENIVYIQNENGVLDQEMVKLGMSAGFNSWIYVFVSTCIVTVVFALIWNKSNQISNNITGSKNE